MEMWLWCRWEEQPNVSFFRMKNICIASEYHAHHHVSRPTVYPGEDKRFDQCHKHHGPATTVVVHQLNPVDSSLSTQVPQDGATILICGAKVAAALIITSLRANILHPRHQN